MDFWEKSLFVVAKKFIITYNWYDVKSLKLAFVNILYNNHNINDWTILKFIFFY
jgi:hypothetical protein